MPETDVTGATLVDSEVTPDGEESDTRESKDQETAAKLEEFQRSLQELQAKLDGEVTARAQAEAAVAEAKGAAALALKEKEAKEAQYKGLQRETTNKMQELAALRQQISNQTITATKLDRMEKLINHMAGAQLDPETVQRLNEEVEREQQRQELESYKAQAVQAQQRAQGRPFDVGYRRELYEAYFQDQYPNVNPEELSEADWARDAASAPEWRTRTEAAFARIAATKKQAEPQEDIAAKLKKELFEEVEALRKVDAEKLNESQKELQELREKLAEQQRLTDEAMNRVKGMDRTDGAVVPVTPAQKGSTQLSEVPDSWLYGTPEQKRAYHDAMNSKSLRDKILGRA